MKQQPSTRNHKPKRVLKTIAVVAVSAFVLNYVFSTIIFPFVHLRISYSVKEINCDPVAIAERNKQAGGSNSKACIIIINATNLDNRQDYVDYDGVGGGPFASWDPMIRIYAADGKYCYGALMGEGSTFKPKATNELRPTCYGKPGGSLKDPEGEMDYEANAHPVKIEIEGNPKTTITIHRNN